MFELREITLRNISLIDADIREISLEDEKTLGLANESDSLGLVNGTDELGIIGE